MNHLVSIDPDIKVLTSHNNSNMLPNDMRHNIVHGKVLKNMVTLRDWQIYAGFWQGMLSVAAETDAIVFDGGELYSRVAQEEVEWLNSWRSQWMITEITNPYELEPPDVPADMGDLWQSDAMSVAYGFRNDWGRGYTEPEIEAAMGYAIDPNQAHPVDEVIWFYHEPRAEENNWHWPPTRAGICTDGDLACYLTWRDMLERAKPKINAEQCDY